MSRWRLPLLTLSALLLLTAALWAALPEGTDPTKPQDTDPISQGAKQIRDFKLFVTDVFGIPATPSQVNAAAFAIATPGIVNFPQGIGSTTTQVGITGLLKGNGSGTVTEAIPATQAEMETGTSTTVHVTPGRVQNHPGVAKGFLDAGTDGTIATSYNVTSITDTTIGQLTITWATDFSSINYCATSNGWRNS